MPPHTIAGISMRWLGSSAVAAILVTGHPTTLLAQQGGGPQPPGGRTVSSMADCDALQKEWNAYKDQMGKQHSACLDSYNRSNVQGGPTCSRAPCQQIHYLVYEYGASESSRMMDQCRAAANRIAKQKAEYDKAVAKEKAEQEAAIRRYNEQVAAYNRQLLQALNQRNSEIAEQNRQAQEAVAERNRAAQREFDNLVREYNFRVSLADRANATLQAMRDALRSATSQVSNSVSRLVDDLAATTFDDVVSGTSDASSNLSTTFDFLSVTLDYEAPETVTAVMERVDQFSVAWDLFKAGRSSYSGTSTAQERFDDQISALSSSTPYLFRQTPWVGQIVSDNIQGIGRWGNAMNRITESLTNDSVPTTEEIKESFARSFFPGYMWLNDKVKQVEGGVNQVNEFFGRR